jgi:hypothetical protein
MKRIRIFGLAFVVIFAISAIYALGASAFTNFVAHPVGGTILDHNLNTHKFTTEVGTVECKKEASKGKVTALLTPTNLEEVSYTECKLTEPFAGEASISNPVNYIFNANGSVETDNEATITTSLCTVKVPAKQLLKEIKYTNESGKLKINAAVTGIEYKTSGFCGSKTAKNGTYSGESLVEVDGGSIEVE